MPVGRNFTRHPVPGRRRQHSADVGNANPSVGGASGLENNYVVDGVNITNTGYGAVGSYSIVFGSLGTGVTTDFIKETQVKTGGFEAEYGQSTGGVVNVVTQSGTNAFHGSVFGYFRPAALEDEYSSTSRNGTVNAHGHRERGLRGQPGRAAGEGQAVLLRRVQPAVPDPDRHGARRLPARVAWARWTASGRSSPTPGS